MYDDNNLLRLDLYDKDTDRLDNIMRVKIQKLLKKKRNKTILLFFFEKSNIRIKTKHSLKFSQIRFGRKNVRNMGRRGVTKGCRHNL